LGVVGTTPKAEAQVSVNIGVEAEQVFACVNAVGSQEMWRKASSIRAPRFTISQQLQSL
jgi:hypothetical protein